MGQWSGQDGRVRGSPMARHTDLPWRRSAQEAGPRASRGVAAGVGWLPGLRPGIL